MCRTQRSTLSFALALACVLSVLPTSFVYGTDAVANSYPPVVQGQPAGPGGPTVAVDAAGNRYITGGFSGTCDFNPGVGADQKSSAGYNDAFVTRFNADGSYAWTQTFGGGSDEYGQAIALSPDGATVYATGYFLSSTVKIGGAGPTVTNSGSDDAFVIALEAATGAAKTSFGLSSSGIQKFGGSSIDRGCGLAVSGTTVYATGYFFSSTVRIGGTGPTVAITSGGYSNAFVIALDAVTGAAKTDFGLASSGIQKFGGSNWDYGYGLAVSGTTVYATGYFQSSTVQIGGAGPTVANTSNGCPDAFVIALDAATGAAATSFGLSSSGIQKFGGSGYDYGYGLAVSGMTLYATGKFKSDAVKIGGAGPNVANSGIGSYDAFVIALDAATGAAKTSFGHSSSGIQKFGGLDSDSGYGLAVSGTTVYVTGNFVSSTVQIEGAGPTVARSWSSYVISNDAFVIALDAGTGAAKTSFGLSSSGIQKFGGSSDDYGYGLAALGSTVYVHGQFSSTNAQVGGSGPAFDSTGFNGFVLGLDANTGQQVPALPYFTSSPSAAGGVGSAFSFTLTAANNPTAFTAANLPPGLAYSAGTISGTPTAAGTFSVVISATNAVGTVSAILTIAVINDQVAISYPPVVQGSQVSPGGPNVVLDAAGNRYITGHFSGTCDFNPGVGTDAKISAGGSDAFVTRFNADGSYGWTQTLGGAGDDHGTALGLSPDEATVYATGNVQGNMVQVGGAGPAVVTGGGSDAFVVALDAVTGAAKTSFGLSSSGIQMFGGAGTDYGYSLAVSGTTLYATGYFQSSTVQIGGAGPTVANSGGTVGTYDAFVIALDAETGAAKTSFGLSSSGIQKFGGSGYDYGYGLAVSGTTVYATGSFGSSTVQIGGAGPTVANSGGSGGTYDAFVIALDAGTGAAKTDFGLSSSGIQKFGGTSDDYGYGLAFSGMTLYATGSFGSSTAQIGGAGPTVASGGGNDAFVIALDAGTGAAKTDFGLSSSGIQKFGGNSDDCGYGLTVSGTTIYATGSFRSSTVQIGGAGPTVANSGGYDAFVIALDAETGAAKTAFGLSSSGIQKFGGSSYDYGYGLATFGSTLYVHGQFSSTNAQVGGSGPAFDSTGFNGFVLGLDANTGQQALALPYFTSSLSVGCSVGSAFSYTLTAANGPAAFSVSEANLPSGLAYSAGVISGTPTTAGTFAVVISASSPAGTVFATLTITVLNDQVAICYPPVVQGSQYGAGGPNVAIDAAGNRYITGYFSGTCEFNPGEGADAKASAGGNDAFITRFNADGSYGWAQTFGGVGDDYAIAIAVSPDGGTVYATGCFSSDRAQIGGAGPTVANGGGSGGTYDAFVIALDAETGAAKTSFGLSSSGIQKFGGSGYDYGYGLAVSGMTLYATGSFNSSTVQTGDAGPTVANSGSGTYDAFVIALDAETGAAKTSFGLSNSGIQKFGGNSDDYGYGLAVSGTTVYATGKFSSSTVQIGGAGPTVAITSSGSSDAFVIALDVATGAAQTDFGLSSSGIQEFGGSNHDCGNCLAVSGTTVYATGYFASSTVQIGGAGPTVANSGGSGGTYDAFVIALDAGTGAAKTSFGLSSSGIQKFGGSSDDRAYGLAASGTTVYATGHFYSNAAQIGGAGPTVANTSSGYYDAYLIALDAATGAAKTDFGLTSSGIQKFGGYNSDYGYGLATFGSTVYVHGQFRSTNAQVGGSGLAYDSTGFNGFLLGLNGTTGQEWPAYLAITQVNGGTNPTAGVPFTVSVECRNRQDAATSVVLDTAINLRLKTGTGSLGGTLTGTIAAGTSSVAISGVTYTKAEGGVVLTASRTSGDTLWPCDSTPFTVVKGPFAKFALALASPQANGWIFSGANTLTAQDAGVNTITTFDASLDNVTVVANAPLSGSVTGLGTGSNNVLDRASDFVNGVANLTALGMIYGGSTGTGTFTATCSTGKTGTSGNVTIIDASAPMVSIAWGAGTTGKTAGDVTPLDWTVQDAAGSQLAHNETCVSNDAHNNLALLVANTSATGTNARVSAVVTSTSAWSIGAAPAVNTFALQAQLGTNPQAALAATAQELTVTTRLAKSADQALVLTVKTPTDITRDAGVQKTIFVTLTANLE